ncbi:MAG: ABC-F family ATP-binding cassette domain-containing protein [Cryobacterium sp.]|nr:ABC-F family ATP-binding cassette domain-containing protein [Oligoflexia bacterium]
MENLIQLQKGSKSFGSRRLFEDASFAINEGEHVGVIGPNGAGKTTLFKVLADEETMDTGKLVRSRNLRLGYLAQHDTWKEGETVEDFVERGATLPIWELKSIGRGLGLEETHYASVIASLSGGYRMRAKLLRLIGTEPNLMLLDEPTNYLDLETLLVLEKFLQGYEGAFLVISHDREFLRRTTDHILEVEAGDVVKYNGNIDDYFEQKAMIRTQLEARAMSIEEKKKQVLDFVARFGAKATKASQAQSRLKSLDRMETIEVKPVAVTARIRIPPPARVGKLLLSIEHADLGYGEKTILSDVSLRMNGGDHLAVVGLNGAGKSTLLKALAGKLTPKKGTVEYGYETSLSFFNQFVAEDLNPNDTVLSAMQRKAHRDVLPQDILDLAGSLLFSGDDAKKPIRVLSGGERSRVALGQVLLQKASCLVLDEPTNHLDFQTVEALTQALQAFTGAIIVVSHDRSFVRRIGTKMLEIAHGKANLYPGTYDEYVWSMEKGAFFSLQKEGAPEKSRSRKENPNGNLGRIVPTAVGKDYRELRKTLDKRLRQLDHLISSCDLKMANGAKQIAQLNEVLLSGKGDSSATISEMGKIQKTIDEAESLWVSSSEEREDVVKQLSELTG